MNSTPLCWWNFRVLAARWIHVLWLVPLACVMTALAICFQHPRAISSAVFQIRPGFLSLAPGSCIPSTLSSDTISDEVRLRILSPELLRKVVASERLTSRWEIDENSVILRLRGMIDCEVVPDTSLVVLRASGRDGEESLTLCRALVDEFKQSLNQEIQDRLALEAARETAAADQLEELVDRKRAELSELYRLDVYSEARRQLAMAEFKNAQRALDDLRIQQLSRGCLLEEPVIVHEEAASEPVFRSLTARLGPLLLHLAAGLLAGFTSAIAILYLLEWLFPLPRISKSSISYLS